MSIVDADDFTVFSRFIWSHWFNIQFILFFFLLLFAYLQLILICDILLRQFR